MPSSRTKASSEGRKTRSSCFQAGRGDLWGDTSRGVYMLGGAVCGAGMCGVWLLVCGHGTGVVAQCLGGVCVVALSGVVLWVAGVRGELR